MALQGTASFPISLPDGEIDDNSKPDVDDEHVDSGGNEEKVQDNEDQLRAALETSIASATEEAVDPDRITDEMVSEVMVLLRLFGVPFLVSPMEAEAQCTTLEQLELVDGLITDDSDIFPFGGQRVYKNIFHHHTDYTDGVHGIGIVNASEIVAAYPGIEGLREFKDWVREFHVAEESEHVACKGNKKKNEEDKENGDDTVRTRFQRSHGS
ncbi:hypothetical protein PsorP6_004726 [Peronosclerospora sorghi]|uniref:Uncharacterized protein n=1 Tax=Peronosclerospora sorghi TaxID=230839 RepID=A0ACC0VL12_9STRA|nr:hypothetical protein PsorP6_004726 [Peronosclerospora sorghi]